jgi:hypothetical protein
VRIAGRGDKRSESGRKHFKTFQADLLSGQQKRAWGNSASTKKRTPLQCSSGT